MNVLLLMLLLFFFFLCCFFFFFFFFFFFASSSSSLVLLVVCTTVHLFCLFLCSMGPEFDPVETASNDVQDEMPQLVKPHSGKEEFYNRNTAAA